MEDTFHGKLQAKIDDFVHLVYLITKSFPKEEIYGVTSQLRRAALSVALNYVEGYARGKRLVLINFLEISYGSLKESMYLLDFSHKESYISKDDYEGSKKLADEIGAMIWKTIQGLKKIF